MVASHFIHLVSNIKCDACVDASPSAGIRTHHARYIMRVSIGGNGGGGRSACAQTRWRRCGTNVACVCALREIIVMTGMRTRHSDQSTICQNAHAYGIKSENLHANSSLSSRRGHRFHAHLLACQSGSTKINMMRARWQSESYRTHKRAHTLLAAAR